MLRKILSQPEFEPGSSLPTIRARVFLFKNKIQNTIIFKGLLKIIVEGRIESRREPERISWMKNLRQWFNKSTRSLFRAIVDQVKIAIMLANVHDGRDT